MLRYLRENTGNWIIKIFLGIIVIVFVFLGVGSFGSKNNNSVATIDDEVITVKEFQQAYKTRINQLQAQFGKNLNEDLIKALNVKQQTLDALIEQKLLTAEADRLDVLVSEKELEGFLLSIKAFQKNGVFDLGQYKQVLGQNSLNPEIFEQSQREAMRQQKVKNMVISTIHISDDEARQFYLHRDTKILLDYIFFAPSVYSDIHPDEKEIRAYYEENKSNYMSQSKRKAAYLKFSPADYKDQVNISDETARAYYEQNITTFQTPEKVEARHILIRLEPDADDITTAMAEQKAMDIYDKAAAGQDFEELAREFSEGPSKTSGGYLGTFEHASMVKPFADAAFALKPGEISKPVKTRFGLHIIQSVAKFDASTRPFPEAAQKIVEQLTKEEMQNIAYDMAGEAFDAVLDGDDLEQVSRLTNKKIKKTDAFDITGNGLLMAENKAFAKAAFDLPEEDISDVKQFGNSYYLIKILDRIDPAVQAFDRVRQTVARHLVEKMQRERAQKDAQALLEKAVAGKSFAGLGLPDGVTVKTTDFFTRNGTIKDVPESGKLIEKGFSLDSDTPVYPEPVETSAGFYLICFKEKKLPEASDTAKNLETIKNELMWRKQSQSYQAWLGQLKKNRKIKYNPSFLN